MKRGKKSTAELATVTVFADQRLQAPEHLTAEQKFEWKCIVDSLPADYFRPGDVPLLAAYCTAAAFYKKAAADLESRGITMMDDRGREFVNPAHQILTSQASAMSMLSHKLRLSPSSRHTSKTAGTKQGDAPAPKRPWDVDDQEKVA